MIRLLVADDHPIVREGIKRVVSNQPDMAVVAEATTGTETLVELTRHADVDVVLLDVSMPGSDFLETLRSLRGSHPDVRVLVLSVHPEAQYAVHALRGGAAGYLTKDHSPLELAAAIRKVHAGHKHLTESLQDRLAAALETNDPRAKHETLSAREFQVLCMIGSGRSVTDIAQKLELSPKTVSTYRSRILEKTGMRSNAELIRYAVEHRLVE